jgi:cyclomaltodextrinase / maltogenic alpha-amylase / neopullulanase
MIKLGKYRHYKDIKGEHIYEVLNIARHSETLEELVIYKGLYDSEEWGKNPIWARPLTMFNDEVELDGKKIPRFTYLGE